MNLDDLMRIVFDVAVLVGLGSAAFGLLMAAARMVGI